MAKRAVRDVKFYPPADPPGPDDDPYEIDTPVCINFTDGFAERVYEEVCDGYMTLTEEEFQQMRAALNKAHEERQPG
jgi:hypothetical protein